VRAHEDHEVGLEPYELDLLGRPSEAPYLETIAEIRHRVSTGSPAARPLRFQGYDMRSRLEVRFAIHLDGSGERWLYEPAVYGDYLPDFELLGLPQPTFVEVKPTLAEVRAAAAKMEVIWKSHPDALLIVACEEGCWFFAAVAGGPWERWPERWS
jgi:hypothetical protein